MIISHPTLAADRARPDSDFRCFDNGGKTADRYTILPARKFHRTMREDVASGLWEALGANDCPYHPQGIGMHVSAAPGRHLGRRVALSSLPADVQRFAQTGLFSD